MKWHREAYWISDDRSDVDVPAVHRLLSATYWAATRPPERTERALRECVCFSLKQEAEQIGFARVLNDGGSHAVVVDVVVDPRFQGRGLGRWLMSVITSHPRFEGMVQILWTADRVEFYKACGLDHATDLQVMRKAPDWMKAAPNPPAQSVRSTGPRG